MNARHFPVLGALLFVAFSACTGEDFIAPEGTAKPASAKCSATDTCTNGTCVDGYCCDTACTGTCEACDVAGHEGQCTAVTGKPRHGTCDGDPDGTCAGSCDGKTAAKCTYPETACSPSSCAANVATLPSTCKNGTCPAATATQQCAMGCYGETCLGVQQLAAGYYSACAVLTDKKVRCWGNNDTGQIGAGAVLGDKILTPVEVPGLTNVRMVAGVFSAFCALIDDGTVKCWGSNSVGQLGNGAAEAGAHPTPALVPGLAGVSFIAGSAGGHFCAILTGGGINCWGINGLGELGNGTTSPNTPSPTPVCALGATTTPCTPLSGATFVGGGDDHTCAIVAGNQVACWGGNEAAQLGLAADSDAHPFPTIVPGLQASFLSAGHYGSCAVTLDGGAKCWGVNGGGRLGNGTNNLAQVTPVSVCTAQDCSTLVQGATQLSSFDVSVCVLASGAVKCWGDNAGGQLGDGNATTSQNFAGSTAIPSGAVQVVSGGKTNYAVVVDRANRDIRCWGDDTYGQCGDNPPTSSDTIRKTPVAPLW